MTTNHRKGFTLIETLVYIVVLVIVVFAISSFLIWSLKTNAKVQVMRETLGNTRRAMEIMAYEIKEAEEVYEPTGVFDSHPGQLSLETKKYLPTGESLTYLDFYICEESLCLKKEGQDPVALTSERVEVKNLVLSRVVTGQIPSIQIDLQVDYKSLSNKPEYQASVNLKSTVSLRSY